MPTICRPLEGDARGIAPKECPIQISYTPGLVRLAQSPLAVKNNEKQIMKECEECVYNIVNPFETYLEAFVCVLSGFYGGVVNCAK